MGKIKHTKTELKAQRDSLQRFERYLPMLQLKKQQLQSEVQIIMGQIEAQEKRTQEVRSSLDRWVKLFSEPIGVDEMIRLQDVETEEGNIAGVHIPIFKGIHVKTAEIDLYGTPSWVDDALETVETLMSLKAEGEVLAEQRLRIEEELRVTSQRVNLFEKVKIPECRENIRVIRIFLGDEQTASVVRGKIAKNRSAATA